MFEMSAVARPTALAGARGDSSLKRWFHIPGYLSASAGRLQKAAHSTKSIQSLGQGARRMERMLLGLFTFLVVQARFTFYAPLRPQPHAVITGPISRTANVDEIRRALIGAKDHIR